MAIPGPPPPPMGGLKLGSIASTKPSAGPDTRSALLQSIQKGTKLKKTVTNDKSAPVIAGKTSNSNGTSTTNNISRSIKSNANSTGGGNNGLSNDAPKLGGIFGGLSSMPKLKPVGGRCKFFNENVFIQFR